MRVFRFLLESTIFSPFVATHLPAYFNSKRIIMLRLKSGLYYQKSRASAMVSCVNFWLRKLINQECSAYGRSSQADPSLSPSRPCTSRPATLKHASKARCASACVEKFGQLYISLVQDVAPPEDFAWVFAAVFACVFVAFTSGFGAPWQ